MLQNYIITASTGTPEDSSAAESAPQVGGSHAEEDDSTNLPGNSYYTKY